MKTDLILISIIVAIALFFRMLPFDKFLYWSDDEQLIWLTIRHILIDHHPSLVTANVATGVSLGPLFHYLVSPWFWLVNFNPAKIIILGYLFSILNCLAIYMTGKVLGGRKVAFAASFLYAVSFLSSLFDHRFWLLTPNIALISLGLIALIKIVKGESQYLYLLTLPITFAFNSDPSLGVVIVATIFTFLIFRPHFNKKHWLISACLIFILLSPLVAFEIRHQGQNWQAINQFVNQQTKVSPPTQNNNLLLAQLANFARFFYARESQAADTYLCYCEMNNDIPLIFPIGMALMIAYFIFTAVKKRQPESVVLLSFIFAYLVGILIFQNIFKGQVVLHYSLVVAPILFLMAAKLLSKNNLLLGTTLAIFFILNLNTLYHSRFKYPLQDKLKIVNQTISKLPDHNFSLYHSGDVLLAGGGWVSLFIENGFIPQKGDFSTYWGHVYRSYNLYPRPIENKEPKTVVILSENLIDTKENPRVLDIIKVGNIYSFIYDNSKNWFTPTNSLEELYQPNYFN